VRNQTFRPRGYALEAGGCVAEMQKMPNCYFSGNGDFTGFSREKACFSIVFHKDAVGFSQKSPFIVSRLDAVSIKGARGSVCPRSKVIGRTEAPRGANRGTRRRSVINDDSRLEEEHA